MSMVYRSLRALAAPAALAWLAALSLGCASTPNSVDEDYVNDRRARAHYAVAMDHLKQGRTALAIRELRAAEESEPGDPWIQLSLGEAYRLQGRNEDAEAFLKKALTLKPDFQPARLNLSALYVQLGRFPEAITEAQVLIDDPTFPVPWRALGNRGWAEHGLGKDREARETFRLALEYADDFTPALLGLAVIDAAEGHKVEALQGLEKVLSLDENPLVEAEVNYRMGEIYVSLGNREKAMHHLTVAAQTRPSGEWGKRSEEYLKRLR